MFRKELSGASSLDGGGGRNVVEEFMVGASSQTKFNPIERAIAALLCVYNRDFTLQTFDRVLDHRALEEIWVHTSVHPHHVGVTEISEIIRIDKPVVD